MCGISGFTGKVADADAVLRRMTGLITHRGPDSEGYYADETIHMGFRRLSIIDLTGGDQPVYNEDRSLVITFNGEIYNYRALREQLLAAGHRFYTQSDTEVLVHAYEEWGPGMLPRLRGMFAFAIYDRTCGSLFLARDWFGIKPLYYMTAENAPEVSAAPDASSSFVYASEIKSLLAFPDFQRVLNEAALDAYLSFQYVLPPETLYKGIFCLPPAHYLLWQDGQLSVKRWWSPTFHPDKKLKEAEAVDRIAAAFANSVEAHRIADVEVGCFLSSGVDSSWVASFFEGEKAFTVGFDEGAHYNEIDWAARLAAAKHLEHHTHVITPEEYWDNIAHVQYMMDQPLADPSCIALYFVSKLASQYVKVVLSGEGADELFGGYKVYHVPDANRPYQKLVSEAMRRKIAAWAARRPHFKGQGYLIRASKKLEDAFIGNAYLFHPDEKKELLKKPETVRDPAEYCRPYYDAAQAYDDVAKMQYVDIHTWLVGDILLKADRMSMANSLELRVPFLDKEVWAVASRLPKRLRISHGTTKYAMRQAAERSLPKESAEKPKLGFPVPIRVWLREEPYYARVREAFLSNTAARYFHTDKLLALLDAHYRSEADNSRKIWAVYIFLVWYETCFQKAL